MSVRLYPGAETSKHCVCARPRQQCTISSSPPRSLVSENARSQMPHLSASATMMQLPCCAKRFQKSFFIGTERLFEILKLHSSSLTFSIAPSSCTKSSIRASRALYTVSDETGSRRDCRILQIDMFISKMRAWVSMSIGSEWELTHKQLDDGFKRDSNSLLTKSNCQGRTNNSEQPGEERERERKRREENCS